MKSGKVLLGVLAGAAVGAIAGILFAQTRVQELENKSWTKAKTMPKA
jgi:gas vesicle protein